MFSEKDEEVSSRHRSKFPVGDAVSPQMFMPLAYHLDDSDKVIAECLANIIGKVCSTRHAGETLKSVEDRAIVAAGVFIEAVGKYTSSNQKK